MTMDGRFASLLYGAENECESDKYRQLCEILALLTPVGRFCDCRGAQSFAVEISQIATHTISTHTEKADRPKRL